MTFNQQMEILSGAMHEKYFGDITREANMLLAGDYAGLKAHEEAKKAAKRAQAQRNAAAINKMFNDLFKI